MAGEQRRGSRMRATLLRRSIRVDDPRKPDLQRTVAHASHIDIEGCLGRMRECLYWPRMTTQVRDCI